MTRTREGSFGASPARLLRLLAYLALALGAAQAQTAAYLVVDGPDGTELARFDLADDPTWHLAWNHSVTGILVTDYYAFRNGTMLLTHSHTPAYDAGLGHIPGRGREESDGAGGYWIYDLDEPVPGNAYLLRVGSMRVSHTLIHAGVRVNLSELAAGERVRIGVEVE